MVNTGFWFWLGAQWEEPGERVTWWRLVVAALGVGVATGVLFHTRGVDLQVIPFVVWPLLLAGWALPPRYDQEAKVLATGGLLVMLEKLGKLLIIPAVATMDEVKRELSRRG